MSDEVIVCPHCEGDGRSWREKVGYEREVCPQCEGTGEVKRDFKQGKIWKTMN